jgi:hypothetical protein
MGIESIFQFLILRNLQGEDEKLRKALLVFVKSKGILDQNVSMYFDIMPDVVPTGLYLWLNLTQAGLGLR